LLEIVRLVHERFAWLALLSRVDAGDGIGEDPDRFGLTKNCAITIQGQAKLFSVFQPEAIGWN
jgi:hypothetical protein